MPLNKKTIQNFNDGVAKIYPVVNAAEAGLKPVPTLGTVKKTVRYEDRAVGMNRYYAALQANIEINRIIRCAWQDDVSTQDVVVLTDNKQYRIEQKQRADTIEPVCMDLSLSLIQNPYTV